MRAHFGVKFHEIMALQAFFLYRLSTMGAKGQVMDVLLGTVGTYEKLSTRAYEKICSYHKQCPENAYCQG